MKVLHIITDLSVGGAQVMLYRLLAGMDRNRFASEVVSLLEGGPMGRKIEALGVPVWSLGMRRGIPDPRAVLRLTSYLHNDRPDVIQTWMYHANIVGGLAGGLAGDIPVIWAIHHTSFAPQGNKWRTIWTAKAGSWLSHWVPRLIVVVSEQARQLHASIGYAPHRMVVIPNGFDLATMRPDAAARRAVRQELGLSQDTRLIGLMGRFHPQKDHHNFVQAAAALHTQYPEVHFVLCGQDISWDNPQLAEWITTVGLVHRFHLLGRRDDMPHLQAALDIGTLSAAYGEAFPLVIGEAMACGVPCVVTDVGDAAMMVGETGRVVPIRNPQALARAWQELLTSEGERVRLGKAARKRVEEHFNLPAIVARYAALYGAYGGVPVQQFA